MNVLTDPVVRAQPLPTPDGGQPLKGTLKILTFSVRESKDGYPYLVGRLSVPDRRAIHGYHFNSISLRCISKGRVAVPDGAVTPTLQPWVAPLGWNPGGIRRDYGLGCLAINPFGCPCPATFGQGFLGVPI